jgi:hypothetical protein
MVLYSNICIALVRPPPSCPPLLPTCFPRPPTPHLPPHSRLVSVSSTVARWSCHYVRPLINAFSSSASRSTCCGLACPSISCDSVYRGLCHIEPEKDALIIDPNQIQGNTLSKPQTWKSPPVEGQPYAERKGTAIVAHDIDSSFHFLSSYASQGSPTAAVQSIGDLEERHERQRLCCESDIAFIIIEDLCKVISGASPDR